MFVINPESVGWQYLKNKKMLPKYRIVYEFALNPDRFPKYKENINVIRNDTGLYMYPTVTLAKNLNIDKSAFAYRFKSHIVHAKSVIDAENMNPNTKALFFPAYDLEMMQMFFALRESVANTPRLHRMAKIILS